MRPSVLLIETGNGASRGTVGLLRGLGFACETVSDLSNPRDQIAAAKFQIALIRIGAEKSPADLTVRDLKLLNSDMECIAFGGDRDAREVAQAMREYLIFDYLFEPLAPEQLRKSVESAFALHCHRRKTAEFNESEKQFHEKVMDIFDWKSELRAKHVDGAALSLIKQLNMSLFGGGGIGSLLTAVSMAMDEAVHDPAQDEFRVPGEMYELMKEHYQLALRKVRALSDAHKELAASNRPNAPLRITTLPAILHEQISQLASMLAIKEQQIVVGNLPESVRNRFINFDQRKINVILNELYINAMKYSGKGDLIYTLLLARGDFLEIKILNPAYKDAKGNLGIGEGDELKVFEPFYRNSNLLHEEYELEIFDSGMGLAVVKKIVEDHGASVYLHTIKNYAAPDREHDVCVTIRCPLLDSDQGNFPSTRDEAMP